MIDLFTFEGSAKGGHLLVLGAVHGNERCGTAAIARAVIEIRSDILKLTKGRVVFAPICNPEAYKKNKRYIDVNLNRVIAHHATPALYEEHRANEITQLIAEADIVLDLHSYSSGTKPFLFLDYDTSSHHALARATGIENWITGWADLYGSQAELSQGDTVSFSHNQGKNGILIECGQHDDPAAILHGYNALRGVMNYMGLCPFEMPASNITRHHMQSIVIKTTAGHFVKNWKHLDIVEAGEAIAIQENGRMLFAPQKSTILLPATTCAIGEEWYYLGAPQLP